MLSAAYSSRPSPYGQLEAAMEAGAEPQCAHTPAPTARSWLPQLPSAFEGTLLSPAVTNLQQEEAARCAGLGDLHPGETRRTGQRSRRASDMCTACVSFSPLLHSTPHILPVLDNRCMSLPTELPY